MQLKTFREPSEIIFDVEAESNVTIKDTRRGHTFLYKGSVSMRADVSGFQSVKALKECAEVQEALKSAIWVTNLQTGRTFVADKDEPIQFIKVRMTVEGVQ